MTNNTDTDTATEMTEAMLMKMSLAEIDKIIGGLGDELTSAASAIPPDHARATRILPVLHQWQRWRVWRSTKEP
jgi:hypothetical protein